MDIKYNNYGSEDMPFYLESPIGIYLISNLAYNMLENVSPYCSDISRRSQIQNLVIGKTAEYLRLVGRSDVLEDAEKFSALKIILVNRLAVFGFGLGASVLEATSSDFKGPCFYGHHHGKNS